MPAKSKAQQRFMGAALECKRKRGKRSGKAGQAAKSMTAKQLSDYAGTKRKGLPEKKKRGGNNGRR